MKTVTDFIFLGYKIPTEGEYNLENKDVYSLEGKLWQTLTNLIKKQGHHFANKTPYSQSDGFSSSHVQMWELDYKEGWAPKNW